MSSCSRAGLSRSTSTRASPTSCARPWRDRFNDRFVPVFYAEAWGDYFGFWSWGSARGDRTDAIDSELARQSALGLLPTGLALAGVLALLALGVVRPREDPGRLVVALPPVAATTAVLYFAVAYPTNDGDTIKATYAMAAVPALAVCFGFAVERLAARRSSASSSGVAPRRSPPSPASVPRLVSSLERTRGTARRAPLGDGRRSSWRLPLVAVQVVGGLVRRP